MTGVCVRSDPGGDCSRRCGVCRKAGGAATAPKILLDQPLRAVEYQLNRLSNDELVRVERNDTDEQYRPVYFALLTRKGLAPSFRADALAAIVKLDGSAPTPILLEALGKIPEDDDVTAERRSACWWRSRRRAEA